MREAQAFAQLPADSVRNISKRVEWLIDSQINLICALLEIASLGNAPRAVMRRRSVSRMQC
jgi:hypothetical protein